MILFLLVGAFRICSCTVYVISITSLVLKEARELFVHGWLLFLQQLHSLDFFTSGAPSSGHWRFKWYLGNVVFQKHQRLYRTSDLPSWWFCSSSDAETEQKEVVQACFKCCGLKLHNNESAWAQKLRVDLTTLRDARVSKASDWVVEHWGESREFRVSATLLLSGVLPPPCSCSQLVFARVTSHKPPQLGLCSL